MTARDIAIGNPLVAFAALRDPVELSGAFVLWAQIVRPSNTSLVVICGDQGETNSALLVNDALYLCSQAAGGRGSNSHGTPPATGVVRVRRDAHGEIYFAWEGKAEFIPDGTSANLEPYTFTIIGGAKMDGAGVCDSVSDRGCFVSRLRIEPGDTTPAERAAIEMDLFGFTL